MKEKIKKELMNRVGTTWFDKFIYVLKLVTIIFSINITLSLFMGFDDLANSYPRFLWVLAGIIPAIYMVDVFYRSTKGIKSLEEFRIMNITSFILFCIHTFIEVVIFRIFGFSIDIYYLQILIFLMFSFVFVELVSFMLMNIGKLCPKINRVIEVLLIPLFSFSGVVFSANQTSNRYLKLFLKVNPITYIMKGFRDSFVYKKWFLDTPVRFAFFMVVCIFLLLVGFILNKINKKK